MDKLPDYLIEKYIIPFLTSDDLFYKFRSLGPYYYHCARSKILIHFPEEMMKTLQKIVEFNMKEDLTKNFEEITQKLFNEKKALLILMIHLNPSLLIKVILENTRDERAISLIEFFYELTKNDAKQNLIREQKYDELQELSGKQESIDEMNNKMQEVINEDNLDYDLNDYNLVLNSLDEEFLRENNFTHNLYEYVSLIVQFAATKIRFSEIRGKLGIFFNQINEASVVWPKKRNFYEKSIELVADTQILSSGAKKMLELFKRYDIENDMTDFNYEKEIIKNYNDKNEYQNIKSNRKKLNFVILRIHQMYAFFIRCVHINKNKNTNLVNLDFNQIKFFNVSGNFFPVEEFLYILSMIKSKFTINEVTFFLTRNHLYHHIYHEIYNINPPLLDIKLIENSEDKEQNKNEEEKNKKINAVKTLSLLNENIGDGINNFDSILESTKNAGAEINSSFQLLSQNLERFSNQLNNNNNKNNDH